MTNWLANAVQRVSDFLDDLENKDANLKLDAKWDLQCTQIKFESNFKSPLSIIAGLWGICANLLVSLYKKFNMSEGDMRVIIYTLQQWINLKYQSLSERDVNSDDEEITAKHEAKATKKVIKKSKPVAKKKPWKVSKKK